MEEMHIGAARSAVMAELFERANDRHLSKRRLSKWYVNMEQQTMSFEYYIEGQLAFLQLRMYGPKHDRRVTIGTGLIGTKQPGEIDYDFVSELVKVFRILFG